MVIDVEKYALEASVGCRDTAGCVISVVQTVCGTVRMVGSRRVAVCRVWRETVKSGRVVNKALYSTILPLLLYAVRLKLITIDFDL